MPWLTPNSIPEARACRALFIPDDPEIIADVSGALLALTKAYNWEKFGTVEPSEIASAMLVMYLDWLNNICDACELPTGTPPFRVGFNGRIQQLDNGEWVEPFGDYAIPPTPARHEPTPEDRRCLAAANAASVLERLYEEVSDAVNEGEDAAEIIVRLATAIIGAIGAVFGIFVAPIITIIALLFNAFIEIAQFITADLWTEEFNNALKCYLYECSSDESDVVTFDLNCVLEKFADDTDPLGVGFYGLRLFGQVAFILNVIGEQGLAAAGATTEIESATCDCQAPWCRFQDYELSSEGWDTPNTWSIPFWEAKWVSGTGWKCGDALPEAGSISIDFDPTTFTYVDAYFHGSGGGSVGYDGCTLYLNLAGITQASVSNGNPTTDFQLFWEGEVVADQIVVIWNVEPAFAGNFSFYKAYYGGQGENPFGEDNCEL